NDIGAFGVVTMGVHTDIYRPWKWHWKKNGKLIAGAQSAPSYTTPVLYQDSQSNTYSCIVFGAEASEETPEVTVASTVVNIPAVPLPAPPPPRELVDAVAAAITASTTPAAKKGKS